MGERCSLQARDTNEVLVVDNPETLTGREAQRVTVTGDVIDGRIRIHSVQQ